MSNHASSDFASKAQLGHDIRDAVRSLKRTPTTTAAVLVLIALVIGGNTTVFSILHGVLTKPAAGVRAANLVSIDVMVNGRPYGGGNSYPNFVDYTVESTTVRPLVASEFAHFTLTDSQGSYAMFGNLVSTGYFETFGVLPVAGRTFEADDDRMTSGLVAVISETTWQRQFRGAASVVGSSIVLNGLPATIIGVAAPGFQGVILGESASVWVPIVAYARLQGTERTLNDRSDRRLSIFGRLAPGVSLTRAQAEFESLSRHGQAAAPDANAGLVARPMRYGAVASGSLLGQRGGVFLAIFSIVTLLTVLVVCANVANLMLARTVDRLREVAVRQALGASRGRIVQMLLIEGLLISAAACVVAGLFTLAMSKVLKNQIPPDPRGMTIAADFSPDWAVVGYAILIAAVGTVAFSITPVIRIWRQDLLPWLKAGERGIVSGRSRVSNVLVAVQLACAVVLLTSAGLAYRSFSQISRVDLGFREDHLLLVAVNTAGSAATKESNVVLLETLRQRLRAVPAVTDVSYVRWSAGSKGKAFRRAAEQAAVSGDLNYVGPDYVKVLGVAPVMGHEFMPADGPTGMPGAIINQHLADTLWPDQPALGRSVLVGTERRAAEVVGVVPNGFFNGFQMDPRPNFVFLSERQAPAAPGETTFYVRYGGSLEAIAPAVSQALAETDARVPIVAMRSMATQLESTWKPVQAIVTLLAAFALGALCISTVGLYAVVAFSTRQRTTEFGVRLALGASSQRILRTALGEGLRPTVAGLVVGFALSLAIGAAMRGVLYGVAPTDATTYLEVFALLTVTALAACYMPARRAARINPVQALRND